MKFAKLIQRKITTLWYAIFSTTADSRWEAEVVVTTTDQQTGCHSIFQYVYIYVHTYKNITSSKYLLNGRRKGCVSGNLRGWWARSWANRRDQWNITITWLICQGKKKKTPDHSFSSWALLFFFFLHKHKHYSFLTRECIIPSIMSLINPSEVFFLLSCKNNFNLIDLKKKNSLDSAMRD